MISANDRQQRENDANRIDYVADILGLVRHSVPPALIPWRRRRLSQLKSVRKVASARTPCVNNAPTALPHCGNGRQRLLSWTKRQSVAPRVRRLLFAQSDS